MHVSRLYTLHQASDVLRRASRFVILARRLQVQMNEMNDKVDREDKSTIQIDSQDTSVPAQNMRIEDEKERAIAKAALSIAELGVLRCRIHVSIIICKIPVSLLEGLPDESPLTRPPEDDDDTQKSDDAEITQDISLRSINAISTYEPFIQDARIRVTVEMENMVVTGLKTLVSMIHRLTRSSTQRPRTKLFLLLPFKQHIIFEYYRLLFNGYCLI